MATETPVSPPADDLGFDSHLAAGGAKLREGKSRPEAEFHQPPVEIGDVVLWSPDQQTAPEAMALVTRVYPGTIDVAVLAPGMHNFMPYDGCRHFDHPDANIVRQTGSGVWCHTNNRVQIMTALSKIAVRLGDLAGLDRRVEALEKFNAPMNKLPPVNEPRK